MVNSKSKGKRGEPGACEVLNKILGTNFRRSQQFKGTKESADIIDEDNPNLYCDANNRQTIAAQFRMAYESLSSRKETMERLPEHVRPKIEGVEQVVETVANNLGIED